MSEKKPKPYSIPCPIWQCSGRMFQVEGNAPDAWQTPDFVCNDCGGVYGLKKFEKSRIPRKAKALRILRVRL